MTGIAFRPILLKHRPEGRQVPKKFEALANKIAVGLERDLKAPTRGWKHRVKFTRVVKMGYPKSILIQVTTDDDPYRFQNDGTRSHEVVPRRRKALRWKVGRKAFFSKGHRVRGIKAKNWTRTVKKKWAPEVKRLTEQLMANFAKPDGLK